MDSTFAIKLDPQYLFSYIMRAADYAVCGKFTKALTDCNFVLAKDPNMCDAHSAKGLALLGLKRPQEAVAEFQKSISIKGRTDCPEKYGMAIAYSMLNNAELSRHYDEETKSDIDYALNKDFIADFRKTLGSGTPAESSR